MNRQILDLTAWLTIHRDAGHNEIESKLIGLWRDAQIVTLDRMELLIQNNRQQLEDAVAAVRPRQGAPPGPSESR